MNPYLDKFKAYLRSQDRAPKTVGEYVSDMAIFAQWLEKYRDEIFAPEAITPTDVRDYRNHLLNSEKRSPATINRKLASIRVFTQWACGRGFIEANPASNIKSVKEVAKPPRWLDRKEVNALRRAAEKSGVRNQVILLLMLNTGLRVSEVAGLTLDDVKIGERKGSIVVRGKGTKVRTVPLNGEARKKLGEYLDQRPKATHSAVFVGQKGEPLGKQGIQYQSRSLLKRPNWMMCQHTHYATRSPRVWPMSKSHLIKSQL
jgi:integrase/recombinase XerC